MDVGSHHDDLIGVTVASQGSSQSTQQTRDGFTASPRGGMMAAGRSTVNTLLLEKFRGLHSTAGPTDTDGGRRPDLLAVPFAVYVFGTLRIHGSNNIFMGYPESDSEDTVSPNVSPWSVAHVRTDHMVQGRHCSSIYGSAPVPRYARWSPAAMCDMKCSGLSIDYSPESHLAPGELFWYAPSAFATMIIPTDELESFDPARPSRRSYIRTLMWCAELPDVPFTHMLSSLTSLDGNRFWTHGDHVPSSTEVTWVPAWVYSNSLANDLLRSQQQRTGCSPLIWDPTDPSQVWHQEVPPKGLRCRMNGNTK